MTTNGVFLDRIDSVPLEDDEFSFSFNSWVSVMVDTINEDLADIQDQFNGIGTPYGPTILTQAQIIVLNTAGRLSDGVFIYCSDHVPPCYVGKISGALVQFTTTPFP